MVTAPSGEGIAVKSSSTWTKGAWSPPRGRRRRERVGVEAAFGDGDGVGVEVEVEVEVEVDIEGTTALGVCGHTLPAPPQATSAADAAIHAVRVPLKTCTG
jgi:hypothetical protein